MIPSTSAQMSTNQGVQRHPSNPQQLFTSKLLTASTRSSTGSIFTDRQNVISSSLWPTAVNHDMLFHLGSLQFINEGVA